MHLTSDPYGPYAVRDGKSLRQVLRLERRTRLPEIQATLARVAPLLRRGIPTLMTGDFNSPSHLDWTAAVDAVRPDVRYPVPWPVTEALASDGFQDAYRVTHPDPVAAPGITWTFGYPFPRRAADEVIDRIDLVQASAGVQVLDSGIAGPSGTPDVTVPVDPYPSDHRGVVAGVRLVPSAPPRFASVLHRRVVRGATIGVRYAAPRGEGTDRLAIVRAGSGPARAIMTLPPQEASFFGSVSFGSGGLAPGRYDALLVTRGDKVVSRSTFWVVRPRAPAAVSAPRRVRAGAPIRVRWRNAPGFRRDWVGIWKAGAKDLYNDYLTFAYTGATVAGATTIAADAKTFPPGRYVVRLMRDDRYAELARASFRIARAEPPIRRATGCRLKARHRSGDACRTPEQTFSTRALPSRGGDRKATGLLRSQPSSRRGTLQRLLARERGFMSSPTVRKRAGIAGAALAASFAFATMPAAAMAAPVGLGTAGNFSVLAGSTVTNTGPTTMSAELGLAPGTAVTGAPVASATHISDGPAIQAKSDLVTAYNDAAGQASTSLASAELSGRRFVAGAYKASSALRLSAGSVTLDAQGDPNAVFIFQVGSTLTSASGTSVALVNGAQACNVFWQVASSATFGTGSTFVGTVMALTTITANTGATFRGRLLARNAAVNLDTNTIVTSRCAAGTIGGGGTPGAGGENPTGGDELAPGSRSNRRGIARLRRSPTSGSPGSPAAPGSPGSPRRRACADGFRGTVRGRMIRRVVFRLDGKRIASRTNSPFKVFVRALPGRHVVSARVTFRDATAARTLRMNYRACASALLSPLQGPSQFTG